MANKPSLIIILFFCLFVKSQHRQLLYDFTEIPQSLLLNPGAEVQNDAFIGFPLLSNVYINAGSSGVTLFDLFADDGVSFNTKVENTISNLSRRDAFNVDQQLDILYGGFRSKNWQRTKNYYSFGVYQETSVFSYFPKDLAVLAYEGNPNINRTFNLGDLNFKGEVITVFHFGINKKVNKKLTYGARAKLYSSILNVTSTRNSGVFYTVETGFNVYEHLVAVDAEVQTSGYKSLPWEDLKLRDFTKRALFSGNMGLGFDFGFTYRKSDQFSITGSVQDIGFIYHTKDLENYSLKGSYTLNGVDTLFPEVFIGENLNPYWQGLGDDVRESLPIDTISNRFVTWRPMRFNASAKYAFGRKYNKDCDCFNMETVYMNAVGLQGFSIWRPRGPHFAITAFYYRRLFDFLRTKTTFTVDKFSQTNIGFGLSAHLGNVNFYAMADNLLSLDNVIKANNLSVQFGFNYIFPIKR